MENRIISIECEVNECLEPGVVYYKSRNKGLMATCLKCAGIESVAEYLQGKVLVENRMNKQQQEQA
jgi:hypothetical protein|tara:strand:- start:3606 stop:3803 length:198 start_codon:yes stop_codon:yes gene_type:complete